MFSVSSFLTTPSLFLESEERRKSPFFKVVGRINKSSSFPEINLKSGLSKSKASADCVLILRILATYYKNRGQFQDQYAMVQREILLKQGLCEAEILARDALLHRFLKK